jgi:DNA polymerase-3 subunit chi
MTPRIDFYVINSSSQQERWLFACRLIEKAWRLRHWIHIELADQPQALAFSEQLWGFREDSFIPHRLAQLDESADQGFFPVTLGYQGATSSQRDLLINLSDGLIQHFQQYQRLIEIVNSDSGIRQQSQQHYRCYKQSGYQPKTHRLS